MPKESFKNTLYYLYCIFFLLPQVTNFFWLKPIFFFHGAQLLTMLFLHHILLLTPHFFGLYKWPFFYMKDISLLTIENYIFASTSTYPTLVPLLLLIVSTLCSTRRRWSMSWWRRCLEKGYHKVEGNLRISQELDKGWPKCWSKVDIDSSPSTNNVHSSKEPWHSFYILF